MADHASRGEAALNAGNPAEAITHYNAALAQSPSVPSYYIQRSTAHQRTSDSASALSDAETAVVLATKRAKRELITSAQLRRGIALFQLERYGDAGFVFGIVEKMAVEKSKEKNSVSMWKENLKRKMVALEEDDLAREVTVKEMPDAKALPEPVVASKPSNTAPPATQPTAPTQTPQSKIRHDWYQNNENVYLSLLARGVPKDKAQIDIQPHSVSISFPLVTQSTYDFSLDPLFAAVDAAASTNRILSSKIEVVLKKAQAGLQWPTLEGAVPSSSGENGDKPTNGSTEAGPVYPTSSRKGPKNWDKIAQSFTKPAEKQRKPKADTADESDPSEGGEDDEVGTKQEKKPTNENKTPPAADDADEDSIYVDDYDDEGDPANAFFKKLYSGADPDTRRAMMKSYQESGGTALSTNWNEVGSKKTEITPPEGMEAKKWEI